MKTFILFFTVMIGCSSFSQGKGDVTIYSNTGDKFYVVLNGIRQNNAPETNVKVTGLTNNWYECKIMSANNNFTIEKKIIVKYDTLVTYRIMEKKGKFKLKFFSQTALNTKTIVNDQTVIAYNGTENPSNNSTLKNGNSTTSNNATSNGMSTTTTTTTSSTTSDSNGMGSTHGGKSTETVNVNIGITENGMGTDVNISSNSTGDPHTEMTSNSSNTTSTTTSTSSNGMGTTSFEETTTTTSSTNNNGKAYYEETTTTTTSSNDNGTTYSTSSNVDEGNLYQDDDMVVTLSTNDNCYTSDDEVTGLTTQIKNEAFADDQARIANMAAESKCMNTDQIKRVAQSITFEDSKLDFLKKAYAKCTDQSNYYTVMETLTFSDDKKELEKYISTK
jgi:Domain of unknown function (DUF4476)